MVILFRNKPRGISLEDKKNTANMITEVMPVPSMVWVVLSKHMGVACDATVALGEQVNVGQIIGDSENKNSVPVHSSVSGIVKGIKNFTMPDSGRVKAIAIETDKNQTLDPSVKPPIIEDLSSFLKAVRDSGMVGLGGAGFPTHVKFNPRNLDEVDTLLINGAECEPYLTSDTRTIMEQDEDLFFGISVTMKHLSIKKCIIGIEDNKKDGIEFLLKKIKEKNLSNIEIAALPSIYPQGAEKILISQTTKKIIPEGKLPADVGVIVVNITTIAELGRFFKDGVPLINKRVTVDGGAINQPKNILAPLGTSIEDIANFCGGYKDKVKKILMGGPMMGITVYTDDYPLLKNNNGLLFLNEDETIHFEETPCIRCGRCTRVCPINLAPFLLKQAYEREDVEALNRYNINLCIECGNCSYICPAKQELVQSHRMSKKSVLEARGKK